MVTGVGKSLLECIVQHREGIRSAKDISDTLERFVQAFLSFRAAAYDTLGIRVG